MKVAMLGLGAMGSRMAEHLVRRFELTLYNRSTGPTEPFAGRARLAVDPADAARGVDVVLVMVTDDEASRSVWGGDSGVLAGLSAGTVAVSCSTLSAQWSRELGALVEATGAGFVECPVVGSTPQAEAGRLVGLLGGPRADVDRIQPVLEAFCGRQIYCGGRGNGTVAKLVVNALFAAQVAALDEVLCIGREHGLEPTRLLECLASLPVSSPAVMGVGHSMLAGHHVPGFPIALVEKDVRYAVEAGGGPVLDAVRHRFASARNAGLGALHLSALYGPSESGSRRGSS